MYVETCWILLKFMPVISGNKRVSQLVELTSAEVQSDDLLLIIDSTARESKRIRASEFAIWLEGTGSIIQLAETASYVKGSNVDGAVALATLANTASIATLAQTSSQAISASYSVLSGTASFALSSSSEHSNSASFLNYFGTPNGTASYSVHSANADASTVSSFLLYFGVPNGTASYALTTDLVNRAKNADTASYVNFSLGASVATASYAFTAQSANSGHSDSSSYLIFSPNNGTASYAMAALTFANIISDKGIFLANTQSSINAQLDDVDILWSTLGQARTPIEAVVTVKVPFTSSTETIGTVYLATLDRNTGIQTILDSIPVTYNLGNPFSGSLSGSLRESFTLMGQSSFYGSYVVFVSASNNLQIDNSRTVRFNISSETDTFNVYANVPITFSAFPTASVFQFSSTDGGPFNDTAAGIVTTMSLGKQIFTLNGINNGVTNINYLWTVATVTASNFSNNSLLNSLSGVPPTMTYLSCSNCNLVKFYDFESSSLSVFNCSHNVVTSLPNFPRSMSYFNCSNNLLSSLNLPITLSYLNCSNNSITSLPSTMPFGMTTLITDNNGLTTLPLAIPQSIVSMSVNNNPMTNFGVLPTQSLYLSFNNCPLTTLPTLPGGVQFLYAQSCSLATNAIDSITNTLVNNAVLSGTIDVRGNGLLSATSVSNMTVLNNTYAWTTLYDS